MGALMSKNATKQRQAKHTRRLQMSPYYGLPFAKLIKHMWVARTPFLYLIERTHG